MNMVDIIYKKREGQPLTEEEIQYFVTGYTDGRIPDYQASALLMAIYFQGMNKEETYHLTKVMMHSGDVVDLSQIKGIKVDKHSTGGVGDKTTLIVGPLAAACQVPVAKMSGRGLGFTGGTIDKLEAIPSFQTTVEENAFIDQVNGIGLAIIGQTAHIAPADKSLYALRDVTATVENLSLITSSIMSKKLASGSDAIVLDVKWGTGAFMESLEEAEELGRLMVDIGQEIGKKTLAVITDMNQPLGKAVGNSLEVIEAIETLKGRGPEDIMELSLKLAAYMIFAGGKAASPEEGYELAKNALETGAALKKLEALIKSQGGDVGVVGDYSLFPQAAYQEKVIANKDGIIQSIDARAIGLASQHSGAGRARKEDSIDLAAGIVLGYKVGDEVAKGDILATIYGNDSGKIRQAAEEAEKAFAIGAEKPVLQQLVKKILD
ncbi:MAG: pyrimidine-nucleoside phosphorylase [Anaerovoracaceae bacterium]